jgi:SAM-dependent methyltransferase
LRPRRLASAQRKGGGGVSAPHYVIRGGLAGRERLRVLARVMWPTTSVLLDERVGVAASSRCLDLGCGGGDVTMALAGLAPNGFVVGADMDEPQLEVARREAADAGLTNVDFRVVDVMQPPSDDEQFDLIYARFLLTHLPDVPLALTHMCTRLAPAVHSWSRTSTSLATSVIRTTPLFLRFVQLYSDAVTARGCDPNIGRRLPSLLRATGLADPQMNVIQPAGFDGEVKMIAPITLEAIADSVLSAGLCTVDELNQTVDDLYAFAADDGSVLSIPRVVQVWGRKP